MRKFGKMKAQISVSLLQSRDAWCIPCPSCWEWPCPMAIPRDGSRHLLSCILSHVLFPGRLKHYCFGPLYLMSLKIPALSPGLFLTTPGCCPVLTALVAWESLHHSLGLGERGLWAWPAWLLIQPKLPGLNPLSRKCCWDNLQFPFPGRRWKVTGRFLAWPQGHSWSWTLPALSVTW